MTREHLATFAGGCFWCLEAVFQPLRGVQRVVSGYIGGHVPRPSYEAVCSGMTGHAEAVQVTFDPTKISYRTLLELFFGITQTAAGVAHFAHLGGMLGGWLMIQYRRRGFPFGK